MKKTKEQIIQDLKKGIHDRPLTYREYGIWLKSEVELHPLCPHCFRMMFNTNPCVCQKKDSTNE